MIVVSAPNDNMLLISGDIHLRGWNGRLGGPNLQVLYSYEKLFKMSPPTFDQGNVYVGQSPVRDAKSGRHVCAIFFTWC